MPLPKTLPKNILGKTELSVSRLGFGGAPVGFLDTPQTQITKVLDLLLEHGVNFVDTAAMYKGSEEALGHALKNRRDDVVLLTKCGMGGEANNFPDQDLKPYSPKLITASIDRSLKLLQTDRLDVILLHSCDLERLQQGDAMAALIAARDAGKTRFIGYSGDNDAAQWAVQQPDIAVLETSVNFVDQHNLQHVLPLAQQHDVGVIAKRPLANACWKDLDAQPGFYANYAKTYTNRFAAMDITPSQLGYSGHVEVEWPEIALQFVLAQPAVHVAICGTTSTNHAEINLQAASKNPLRDEAVQRLQAAFQKAQDAAGEPWLGQT